MKCEFSDIVIRPEHIHFEIKGGSRFNPPTQDLFIKKTGPGLSATWDAHITTQGPQFWLKLNPMSGRVPKRVRVHCKSIGMPAGEWEGHIEIKSHVTVTPSIIPVKLTVKGEEPPPPPKPFVCSHCGAEFTKEEELQKHIDQEHPPPPPSCLLSISSGGGGSVTTPGEGNFSYPEGTIVDLVAEPWQGWRFRNWIAGVGVIADIHAAATTITMGGDYTIIANFEEISPPPSKDNWLCRLWQLIKRMTMVKKIWDWIKLLPRIRKAGHEPAPRVDKALERKLAKRIQERAVKAVDTHQDSPNMPKSQPCSLCRRWSKRMEKTAGGANYECPEHSKFFVRAPRL